MIEMTLTIVGFRLVQNCEVSGMRRSGTSQVLFAGIIHFTDASVTARIM